MEWCITICEDDVHKNIFVNPSRMRGFKFHTLSTTEGFKFTAPLSAFVIEWCNMRTIKGSIQCIEVTTAGLKETGPE